MVPYREHAGTLMAVDKYDLCSFNSLPVNMIAGRNLSRSLLSRPTSERTENDGELVGPAHHPQIGLACSLLTDTNRQGPEVRRLFNFS